MKRKIGIIGAMQIEIDAYQGIVLEPIEAVFKGIHFVLGKICEVDVVLCVSGIGKVNSAFVTAALIFHFGVTEIINTGVAGGIGLKPLDIVVATKCCQHDIDTSALGDPLGFLSGGGLDCVFIETDPAMARQLQQVYPSAILGTIATGDVFVATKAQGDLIKSRFGAVAVDCESCSILQVAHRSKVPCAILRSISDGADEAGAMSFLQLAQKASEVAKDVVCAYIKNLD